MTHLFIVNSLTLFCLNKPKRHNHMLRNKEKMVTITEHSKCFSALPGVLCVCVRIDDTEVKYNYVTLVQFRD